MDGAAAAQDPGPGMPGAGGLAALAAEASLGLPGLAARLASIAAELRLITGNYPLTGLPAVAVGDAIEQAQAVREMAHNLTALLAAQVESRDMASAVGLSRNDWVAGHAPNLADGASAAVTAVGAALGRDRRWARLNRMLRDGQTTVDQAAVIVRFHNEMVRVADRDLLDGIVDSLVEHADVLGVKQLRRLAAQARAALKPPADTAADEARQRCGRLLTRIGTVAGLVEYRLRLDPAAAAVLDAAIDPLARPRPDLDWDAYRDLTPSPAAAPAAAAPGEPAPDHGGSVDDHDDDPAGGGPAAHGDGGRVDDCGGREVTDEMQARDPRTPATRRADALLELIARAVAAPEGVTRTPRTQLVVTMSVEALFEALRGTGVADNGETLTTGTIRRLACEAGIIPAVLGGPSEPLDIGRADRYFTRAQRRALALRDHGCTWPHCTVPPQWCEAHHGEHWLDGGATDLSNAALLCGRHHTIVHQLGLRPVITATGVRWFSRGTKLLPATLPAPPPRVTDPPRPGRTPASDRATVPTGPAARPRSP